MACGLDGAERRNLPTLPHAIAARAEGAAADAHAVDAATLWQLLCDAWARHARCPRLSTPLLKMVECLATRALVPPRGPARDAVMATVVDRVRGEYKGCSDLNRLSAIANALCAVSGLDSAATKDALQVRPRPSSPPRTGNLLAIQEVVRYGMT